MEKPYGLTMRGIVKNSEGEILILRRHPKSKTNPHRWELPGGKIEKCEYVVILETEKIQKEEKNTTYSIESMLVDIMVKENCSLKEAIKKLNDNNKELKKNSIYEASLNLKQIMKNIL